MTRRSCGKIFPEGDRNTWRYNVCLFLDPPTTLYFKTQYSHIISRLEYLRVVGQKTSVVTLISAARAVFSTKSSVPVLISLHIRSMWETICDAWACWIGWNSGPNSGRIPLFCRIPPSPPLTLPPQNENCQRVQVWVQNTPRKMKIVRESKYRIPPLKWKLSESPSPSTEYPTKWKLSESPSLSTEYPPKWKLSESQNPRVSEYPPPPKSEKLQISNFRIV